jgi:hypothetical protein
MENRTSARDVVQLYRSSKLPHRHPGAANFAKEKPMKFPVFKAFSATLAYLAQHAVTLVQGLWLPTLLLIAGMAAIMPDYIDGVIAISSLGPRPDPAEAAALLGPMFKSIGLLLLIGAVLYPMLIVASLRHLVRGDQLKAPFYLGFGGDELRVLGAYVLIIILTVVVYLVFALGFGALAAVLAMISPAAAGFGAIAIGFIGLVSIFWFMARISVTFPASIATRTIGVAQSWRATKGNSLQLVGFWILVGLILIVVGYLYAAALMPGLLAVYGDLIAAGADPVAQQEANIRLLQAQRDLYDIKNAAFWPFVIGTFVYTMLMMAVINTASGTAWRYLTDRQPAA